MKRLVLLVFASLALSRAFAQPIDLTSELRGLRVDITTGWIGNMAFTRLNNKESSRVFCTALFRNGPESRERRGYVAPGKERLLNFSATRRVVRMRIHVSCTIPEEDFPED